MRVLGKSSQVKSEKEQENFRIDFVFHIRGPASHCLYRLPSAANKNDKHRVKQ
jgi:hypothetical protein